MFGLIIAGAILGAVLFQSGAATFWGAVIGAVLYGLDKTIRQNRGDSEHQQAKEKLRRKR
jgi:ribose/xylose/arabinose/galactoside ABC-type transport system permease subunit